MVLDTLTQMSGFLLRETGLAQTDTIDLGPHHVTIDQIPVQQIQTGIVPGHHQPVVEESPRQSRMVSGLQIHKQECGVGDDIDLGLIHQVRTRHANDAAINSIFYSILVATNAQ